MATTATRTTILEFTGDITLSPQQFSDVNNNSVGGSDVQNLSSGNNTITVPTGGTVACSVTIIPPPGNAVQITLKGIAGDTGIALHLTQTLTLSLASSVTSFVLNAASAVTGLRLIWA